MKKNYLLWIVIVSTQLLPADGTTRVVSIPPVADCIMPDFYGNTFLHRQVYAGEIDFLQKFYEVYDLPSLINPANVCGDTLLHSAVLSGNAKVLRVLFNCFMKTTVRISRDYDDYCVKCLEFFKKKNNLGNTLFHYAALVNDFSLVEELYNQLIMLLFAYYNDVIKLKKVASDLINMQNDRGDTPLHLLAQGMCMRGRDGEHYIFSRAEAGSSRCISEVFLKLGARVDIKNNEGMIPLDCAYGEWPTIYFAEESYSLPVPAAMKRDIINRLLLEGL